MAVGAHRLMRIAVVLVPRGGADKVGVKSRGTSTNTTAKPVQPWAR